MLCMLSCGKEGLESNVSDYSCEYVYLIDADGDSCRSGTNTVFVLSESKVFTVYPYPNTGAPFTVVSSDENVALPVIGEDGRTLTFECRKNGRAVITVDCGGNEHQFVFSVKRAMTYDFVYNSTSDRFYMLFDDSERVSQHWQEIDVHVTLVWQCYFKSGYSTTSYVNRYYPLQFTVEKSCTAGEPLPLCSLHEDYVKVKEFYDSELKRVKAAYPSGEWDKYSSIILDAYVRPDNQYLRLSYEKKSGSIYGYSLGFTFERHVME